MLPKLLDNPLIVNNLFYPRAARPGDDNPPHIHDGTIPVEEEGVALGYRLYGHTADAPVLLYFHGNGEIASDYDSMATLFHEAGVSLLVVDYRGYGWSTGKPLISTLLSDAETVLQAVPDIVQRAGITNKALFLMGRSLGSAPASHLASRHAAALKGVIIESGFAHEPSLFQRLMIPENLLKQVPSVFGNVGKIAGSRLPLLVIHGEKDTLIPVENGQALFDTSPAEVKMLLRIPGAGHNDLLIYGLGPYFAAIAQFVAAHG
ncbi:MAG: alpha/beta fold hydrolase [Anaerolineaceae bacterium]|nr:alpha/beta fold hydrolase [Anaerolineaceae bacterium]